MKLSDHYLIYQPRLFSVLLTVHVSGNFTEHAPDSGWCMSSVHVCTLAKVQRPQGHLVLIKKYNVP